ncbi:hypothetical protein [Chitinophaga ginsengisoli]|uniref:Uncharacterized protein n=1 Tax=Chitinophaga ginsengisoli TaxID=363837 RepID=A0A2P8FGL8_9BACT|nr:hypothetical protein [Chitinophaga ginsengisoli]PSL20876.1 hypothetical protein CLV42_12452 [Chitinophaga ginsengisoli]
MITQKIPAQLPILFPGTAQQISKKLPGYKEQHPQSNAILKSA